MNTNIKNRLATFAMAAIAVSMAACGKDDLSDDFFGSIDLAPYFADGATVDKPAQALTLTIEPKKAYGNGGNIEYYDFGLVKYTRYGGALVVQVNPMYFFYDRQGRPLLAQPFKDERLGYWIVSGGNPTYENNQDPMGPGYDKKQVYSARPRKVIRDTRRSNSSAHQRPIIDMLQNGTTYSGVWEVMAVTAPDGYEPDSIKSLKTLQKGIDQGDFSVKATGAVVNCPVLDERQAIIPSAASLHIARPRVDVWYRTKLGTCLMTNGWSTIADTNNLADTSETGRAKLFLARDLSPDRNTMPTQKVESGAKGEVSKRVLFVPVGKFFTPMAESKRNDITYQLRYFDQLVADYNPNAENANLTFTPVLSNWDIGIPEAPLYKSGTFKKAEDIDPSIQKERSGGPWIRNLVVLGSSDLPDIYNCAGWSTTDKKCDTVAAKAGLASGDDSCAAFGLTCNPQTCKCDMPTSGYGGYCAPNVMRCKNKDELTEEEALMAPYGFACHSKKPRGNCYIACNADDPDLTEEKVEGMDASLGKVMELDSRCGYRPGFTCVKPKDLDAKKDAICIRGCKTNDTTALLKTKCNSPEFRIPGDESSGDFTQEYVCKTIQSPNEGVTACSLTESMEPR